MTALRHPLTGHRLAPIGYRRNGSPIWPIMGGDDSVEPDAAAKAAADAAAKKAADDAAAAEADKKAAEQRPYPANTAVADMKPEEQVAYWKFHAQEHEKAWKGKLGEYTPAQVAEMQKRIQEIEDASKTDHEKALAEAFERGKAEASADGARVAVLALVDARKAYLDETKDAEIIESLDLLDYTKFITDGSVDSARLTKVLDRLAPVGGGASKPRWPETGQGDRNTGTGSAKDAGKAEAARRFGTGE